MISHYLVDRSSGLLSGISKHNSLERHAFPEVSSLRSSYLGGSWLRDQLYPVSVSLQ
ncbi:hypothetical protein JMJ77_0013170 [Colletotrichum scovillei]|uniref:Uncharacterized protein n=1 Tax=Colletotrichum scovillei TaxID=1209932 RepID=A0A9P7R6S2_9PEZI|nr:hypothetical protein JMJ77_0013170 [Colletotrichum scovillei]KAG7069463.1 hypothetical protein JMJ76_0003132 [Colletotrichum scovillei]KAG7073410.1 hypothetical protein JMJ78_0014386 [Colletotrichum scovillei]